MRTLLNYAAHHQPQRLARPAQLRTTLSADRLQGIDGLGCLGRLGSDMGTDEATYGYGETSPIEASLEKDSDYSALVNNIVGAVGAITPAALNLAGVLAKKNGYDISAILGIAQGRATSVQNGTSTMPVAGWIGIGVAAVAVLGLLFMRGR